MVRTKTLARRIALTLIALTLTFGGAVPAPAAPPHSLPGRVAALEDAVQALQAKVRRLRRAVRQLRATVAELGTEGAVRDDRIAALEARMSAQDDTIAALQATVAEQQVAGETRDAHIAALQATVAEQQAAADARDGQIAALASQVAALEAALVDFALCPVGEAPVCCPEGTTFCGDGCVDPTSDPQNCGACGVVCGAGDSCVGGVCGRACAVVADCGAGADTCAGGLCSCGGGPVCEGGALCVGGACTLCGNGVVDPGEECDDGNDDDTDDCANDCTRGPCAPEVVFAVGVYGTTTCAGRCASEGFQCIGIGTDEGATDGLFNDCGAATSGIATDQSPGTCDTVLGGSGCSEFTNCLCAPTVTTDVIFAVGVYGTTTCESRCISEGGTCVGIGTDEDATDGLFNDCGGATSGIATDQSPGSCATVLGGQGCSEFTNCRCETPSPDCTGAIFAVGVYGTTTCEGRCASEGGVCVGIGTDEDATDGLYNDCGGATSGIATDQSPGSCETVLGGSGCSEFTNCRCFWL